MNCFYNKSALEGLHKSVSTFLRVVQASMFVQETRCDVRMGIVIRNVPSSNKGCFLYDMVVYHRDGMRGPLGHRLRTDTYQKVNLARPTAESSGWVAVVVLLSPLGPHSISYHQHCLEVAEL